jgi:hypothetical protein
MVDVGAMRHLLIAVGIAAAIYGLAVGVGAMLYATGTIATGATNNNCDNFKQLIASERGISEEDVLQSEIAQRTQACLDQHTLTQAHAFRTEYLFAALWPAVISAAIFLVWPRWTRVLFRQEAAELAGSASHMEPGS